MRTTKNLLKSQSQFLLMRLACKQPLLQAGCKKFIAVNLKRTAKNLLGPQTQFLLMGLASRQPHVPAGCKKFIAVNLEKG